MPELITQQLNAYLRYATGLTADKGLNVNYQSVFMLSKMNFVCQQGTAAFENNGYYTNIRPIS